MCIIAFSDIHGNLYALEAFLEDIKSERYDKLIFCGDIFGYYYEQKKIIEILSQIKNLIWLKGNHDDYFCKLYRGELNENDLIEKYGHSYLDVRSKFTYKDYITLSNKSSSYKSVYHNVRIAAFHGTFSEPQEGRLYPKDKNIDERYSEFDIVVLGHTHFRMVQKYRNTLVVNPGSIGQPRDGNGFSYCIINSIKGNVEFRTVDIDVQALYKQIDTYDKNLTKLKSVLERRKEDII